jgi:hypothetical protein
VVYVPQCNPFRPPAGGASVWVAASIIEEMQFRRFLLQPMESLGAAAPVLNVPLAFAAFVPIACVVFRWRNIKTVFFTCSMINLRGVFQLFFILT